MGSRKLVNLLSAWVLSNQPDRRRLLAQVVIALVVTGVSVVVMAYLGWVGEADNRWVIGWSALTAMSMLMTYLAIRSGWSARLQDPSMTAVQMCLAIVSAAAAYALLGPTRAIVLPVLMLIMVFGMFKLRQRPISAVNGFAVALFGLVMGLLAMFQPERNLPGQELAYFVVMVMTLIGIMLLSRRLNRMRDRLHRQNNELGHAIGRIKELATRDELTGLHNRRYMTDLLEQERQRCGRSGRSFCVAIVDIDHFKHVNDQWGHAVGDVVLSAFANECRTVVRIGDHLARWGGEEFVLLLSDARLPLASAGVERLRQRVLNLVVPFELGSLKITISAGVAEHIAGETVKETLARADAALYAAKAGGRDRIALG